MKRWFGNSAACLWRAVRSKKLVGIKRANSNNKETHQCNLNNNNKNSVKNPVKYQNGGSWETEQMISQKRPLESGTRFLGYSLFFCHIQEEHTPLTEEADRVLQVEEGANSWITAIVLLFSMTPCSAKIKKAASLLPQKQSRFQSAIVNERTPGRCFVNTAMRQSSTGKKLISSHSNESIRDSLELRKDEKKTSPSSLMKSKSSQTTRGNEKKKPPPSFSFHFLSSLSSTRGVKAPQELRARPVATLASQTHDCGTTLVLAGVGG